MSAPARLLVLTDRSQLPAGRSLVEQVSRCVDAGLRWVCVRERDLPEEERCALIRELADMMHAAGGRVIVAAPVPDAVRDVVDGVHLRAIDPPAPPHDGSWVVGRSTHSTNELHRADTEGADYVTLSPYAVTATKPGHAPTLGPSGLRELLHGRPLGGPKVLALGGISAANALEAVEAGAHGVAVMGEVMRADKPEAVLRALRGALG